MIHYRYLAAFAASAALCLASGAYAADTLATAPKMQAPASAATGSFIKAEGANDATASNGNVKAEGADNIPKASAGLVKAEGAHDLTASGMVKSEGAHDLTASGMVKSEGANDMTGSQLKGATTNSTAHTNGG